MQSKYAPERPTASPISVAEASPADLVSWEPYGAVRILSFAFLAMLWLALAWGPLSEVSAHYSKGYNEGNAAYFTRQAITGPPIYGAPPKYVFTDYPPLAYHLVGNLARISGDYNSTGRWVSIVAYFAIGVLAALIVRKLNGST